MILITVPIAFIFMFQILRLYSLAAKGDGCPLAPPSQSLQKSSSQSRGGHESPHLAVAGENVKLEQPVRTLNE